MTAAVAAPRHEAPAELRVLHVNADDLPGKRFNGLAAAPALAREGVATEHFVATKMSADPSVATVESWGVKKINKYARRLERSLSLQAMLPITSRALRASAAYARADVLHLHILHLFYFSLAALARLARERPVLWTLHDPWALTGHCVHPLGCERWRIGCGACPHLDTDLKLKRDTTRLLYRYKAWAYRGAEVELIVASPWMERLVADSPLLRDKPRHVVPFGVDTDVFRPASAPDERAAARAALGLRAEGHVLCFREDGQAFKGLAQLVPALERLAARGDVQLLTVGRTDKLGPVAERFATRRLGWVDDPTRLRQALHAADLFVMPSIAESFGMMAIEAMACGAPVVALEGTALPEVIDAPKVGVVAPKDDPAALAAEIGRLLDAPEERAARAAAGRSLTLERYRIETHAERMAGLYRGARARWLERRAARG